MTDPKRCEKPPAVCEGIVGDGPCDLCANPSPSLPPDATTTTDELRTVEEIASALCDDHGWNGPSDNAAATRTSVTRALEEAFRLGRASPRPSSEPTCKGCGVAHDEPHRDGCTIIWPSARPSSEPGDRARALEEAARLVESQGDQAACDHAADIRALSAAPASSPGEEDGLCDHCRSPSPRTTPPEAAPEPYYLADGSAVMLPAPEVERRRKAAAKVIGAALAWRHAMCGTKAERAARGLKARATDLMAALRALGPEPEPSEPPAPATPPEATAPDVECSCKSIAGDDPACLRHGGGRG